MDSVCHRACETVRIARGSSVALLLLAFAGLSGCASIQPEPLQVQEIAATLQTDKAALTKDVPPLSGPLTLEEAIARAIKYNAERRMKSQEEAYAFGTFDAQRYDMLPKLVAAAGYRYRDKDLITYSEDSVTGQPSLANPYISTDRTATTTDLGFSWSLLDFGQSYYAAKQNADKTLIAAERKRKAIHNLIQEVRTSYWRVVAAQSLGSALRDTIREAESALEKARQAETEKLRSPLEPLRYQRQLLENLRLLELIEQELSSARIELANLANLPFSTEIQVVEPGTPLNTAWLNVPAERMEEFALQNNPDLRESFYNARIAQQETRRTILRLFPGLSFNYGWKSSDDEYLVNQNWKEAGLQLSFNLLGLLSAPAQLRLAEAGVALADQKRMATQMAVLTQLHLARLQYANAARTLERSELISDVDNRIAEHVVNQEKAEKQTRQEVIANRTTAILSTLRRYQSLSNAQAAASRLQATLGLAPAIDNVDALPLKDLTATVEQSLAVWSSGQLPELEQTTEPAND